MIFQTNVLAGRAALVTGGGTIIGCGIALALAAPGCDVEIASRREEHLLCSAAASFITGVTLVVDGGLWLRSASILSPAVS